jgi:hypothetical protein
MTYTHKVQKKRARVMQGERVVAAQRERLVQLSDEDRDTWAAERLLAATIDTLARNRTELRNLLSR